LSVWSEKCCNEASNVKESPSNKTQEARKQEFWQGACEIAVWMVSVPGVDVVRLRASNYGFSLQTMPSLPNQKLLE
jgi:hypothetical protein